ncbi:MAG: ATP-dependent zinc metalloprotease FtsH [Armatimonadetes bacterium]|nr:ATP-dependent zinc metalloprotease FtsH [Armatimonadota bacterium]
MVTVFLCIIALIVLLNLVNGAGSVLGSSTKQLQTSELNTLIDNTHRGTSPYIVSSEWQEQSFKAKLSDGSEVTARVASADTQAGSSFEALLRGERGDKPVPYDRKSPPVSNTVVNLFSVILFPLLLVVLFWFFVIRPAQSGGNQAMQFGRSRARRVGETGTKVTFDDVAGIDEAKQELFEIVDFLKNTKKYAALGAKIPKGILLTGPPGVGKTHLARAIAGEAGVPFFHISGSDFVEMFVGVGAARVRDLFEAAKAHRPSLVFVDEIDAVGRQRGAGLGGGHDEREQTLNQLLVEMDGFDPNSGVILIAATNRPDVLDPALLRPGRFDRQIVVDAPDQNGREMILKIHAKGKPFESDVDLAVLAKRTPGFTGADLANMLNESALLAARRGHARISMADAEEALDRVIAGPQRKSRIIDAEEREVIAYHEAGHAVVGEVLEHSDPVHKVTILPRGMSLGSTWSMPAQDKYLVSREELEDDIATLLGGRVAEEIVYNRMWTGASNDLERVARIARSMVTRFGMSARLGTLALGRRSENPFLGKVYSEEQNYSEEVAKVIDEEVRAIVEHAHQRAKDILTTHREQLDTLVQALLERETLDRDEFLAVMAGKALPPMEPKKPEPPTGSPETEEEAVKSNPVTPPRLEPGTA